MPQSSLDGRAFPMHNSAAANTPFTGDSRMRARLGTTVLAVCTLPLTVVAGAQAQNPVTNGLRAIEQRYAKNLVCRLLLEKKKTPADASFSPRDPPRFHESLIARLCMTSRTAPRRHSQ